MTHRSAYEIPNTQTIQDYIANLLETAHHTEYENQLISQPGNYNANNILLQRKKKLPKHAIATSENLNRVKTQKWKPIMMQVFWNFSAHLVTRNHKIIVPFVRSIHRTNTESVCASRKVTKPQVLQLNQPQAKKKKKKRQASFSNHFRIIRSQSQFRCFFCQPSCYCQFHHSRKCKSASVIVYRSWIKQESRIISHQAY